VGRLSCSTLPPSIFVSRGTKSCSHLVQFNQNPVFPFPPPPRVGRSTRSPLFRRFPSLTPPAPSPPSLTRRRCRLLPLAPRCRHLLFGPRTNPLSLSLPLAPATWKQRSIFYVGDLDLRAVALDRRAAARDLRASASTSSFSGCCLTEVLPELLLSRAPATRMDMAQLSRLVLSSSRRTQAAISASTSSTASGPPTRHARSLHSRPPSHLFTEVRKAFGRGHGAHFSPLFVLRCARRRGWRRECIGKMSCE
jgi:hypothetical protein